MATVTLTWEIEGIHDGIAVYRSNLIAGDYEKIATLPPNTTLFEDNFLISQLTDHYGSEPAHLFYRLDAYRGLDVKQGDVVPVPLEDTMPEFLDGKEYLDEIPELVNEYNANYYSVGSKTLEGNKYHVILGISNSQHPLILQSDTGNPFPEMNQYLRGLKTDNTYIGDAIKFMTEATKQNQLESAGDAMYMALYHSGTDTPMTEFMPTAPLMSDLKADVVALANKLGLSGYFWTCTLESDGTNEFGQVTGLKAKRASTSTGNIDSTSILGATQGDVEQAYTLTFILIDDISS